MPITTRGARHIVYGDVLLTKNRSYCNMGNKIIFQRIAYFCFMAGKCIQLHTQIMPLNAFHKSYIMGGNADSSLGGN